jgi:hypothetical protein
LNGSRYLFEKKVRRKNRSFIILLIGWKWSKEQKILVLQSKKSKSNALEICSVMMLLAFNQNMMSRYFFVRRAEMLPLSWMTGGPPSLLQTPSLWPPPHTPHTSLLETLLFTSIHLYHWTYVNCKVSGMSCDVLWGIGWLAKSSSVFVDVICLHLQNRANDCHLFWRWRKVVFLRGRIPMSDDYCIAHALGIRGIRASCSPEERALVFMKPNMHAIHSEDTRLSRLILLLSPPPPLFYLMLLTLLLLYSLTLGKHPRNLRRRPLCLFL